MQLGELQHQIARFQRRGVNVAALSVDKPRDSEAMVKRMGLTFALGSDADQAVIKAFRVQNPDTQELALHAVYIVDQQRRVFYRKVASRRPTSPELIDAIDAYRGVYPQNDPAEPRRRASVAYPTNNFQALLAVDAAQELPASIDQQRYQSLLNMRQLVHNDDALIAVRRLMEQSTQASEGDLLTLAALLARQAYFQADHPALTQAANLRQRLQRVRQLETQLETGTDNQRDSLLEQLASARALLTRTRAIISEQADAWRLRSLKTAVRSYREVALAAYRNR